MESKPLVSAVITAYNRAHLVGRAIDSVLAQTFEDFELVIVDDASQDNTEEVVAAYDDPRIRYIRNETNKGCAGARNVGFLESRGTYVACVDSDDKWLPNKLELQVEKFRTSDLPNLAAVYGTTIDLYEDGSTNTAQAEVRGDITDALLTKGYVVKGGFNSTMLRRDAFVGLGGEDESNPSREDFDFWLRLSKDHSFDFVPEPVVHMSQFGSDRLDEQQPQAHSGLRPRPQAPPRRLPAHAGIALLRRSHDDRQASGLDEPSAHGHDDVSLHAQERPHSRSELDLHARSRGGASADRESLSASRPGRDRYVTRSR